MTTVERVSRILDEGAVNASAIAKLLGSYRQGKPTHPRTITRWMLVGVELPDGRKLRLEHIRVGGRLLSSRAALTRFLAAQQDANSSSGCSDGLALAVA